MPVELATSEDLGAIKRLLQLGRYVYANIADEDVSGVVERGLTMLGGGRDHPWGTLIVDPEVRPFSLPDSAPNRAQVRALALRHGPWTEDGVAELVRGLREYVPDASRPTVVMVYAMEPWLQRALVVAGFAQVDTVVYYRLLLRGAEYAFGPAANHFFPAGQQQPGSGAREHDELPHIVLRPARPEEIHALARMDARAFDSIWHYPANDLMELMIRGRLVIAEDASRGVNGVIAGYTGLLLNNSGEAHLARLAVNPEYQGHGVGRRLLLDAIETARKQNYREFALNTQLSNERSQALYRSVGMSETGVRLPVFTLMIE